MAGAERKPDPTLIRELAQQGKYFDFFSLVQLLERVHRGAAPLGELGPYAQEPVHFRHETSLTFHASDVTDLAIPERGPPQVTSAFLGLYGAVSPLSIHFSEAVIDAENSDQPTLRAFYDLFHHRVLCLYFRAWKKYRISSGFRLDGEDPGTKRFLCFVGVDGHGRRAETGLSTLELLELAPLLAMRARPKRVLILALERLLPGVKADIEQFVLRRAQLDDEDRFCLGRRNNLLGQTATIGRHVQDRSARFRLILGPVDYTTCEALMPGGRLYPTLRRVVEQFTRGTLECEVDVILKDDSDLGYCLGALRGATLGVNTRLGKRPGNEETRMRFLMTDNAQQTRAILVSGNAVAS